MNGDPDATGRSVEPVPSLTLILEPRSAVVTTGDLYTMHLHGIDEIDADTFAGDGLLLLPDGSQSLIANRHMIQDKSIAGIIEWGGIMERTTRYSLTCRDVEKVAGGRVAGVFSRS